MGQTAIISQQILDSTSLGRDLIAAADQAAAQAIIGVTGVDTGADYNWTGDHQFDEPVSLLSTDWADANGTINQPSISGFTYFSFNGSNVFRASALDFIPMSNGTKNLGRSDLRFADVYSVDGDFSGTVTAPTIAPVSGGSLSLGESDTKLTVAPATDQVIVKTGNANHVIFNATATSWYQDMLPNVAAAPTMGRDDYRWAEIYSVDGSFSGNLDIEAGGSQRVYKLGTEGDTDTEYLDISADTALRIYGKATGSGTIPEVTIGNTQQRWRITSSGLIATVGTVTKFSISTADTVLSTSRVKPELDNTTSLGVDGQRWRDVASVNGSFSGNLNVEVGGSQRLYNLGTDGDTDTEYLDISATANEFFISPKLTGAGARRDLFVTGAYGAARTHLEFQENGNLKIAYGSNANILVGGSYVKFRTDIDPNVDNTYTMGTSSIRWANVYSVDGDFSGVIKATGGLDIDSGQMHLKHAGSLRIGLGGAGIFMYDDILPNYSTITNGTSTKRWGNTYSVNGSFSGNLNVEVGGSQRLYNLGAEGDADTEYLEIEGDTSIGYYKIQPKYTGTGRTNQTLRILAVQGSHISLYSGGQFVYTHAGVQHLHCSGSGVSITDLDVSGTTTTTGLATGVQTITAASDTLVNTDHTNLCDCTSNAITVNLPAASAGQTFVIKKIDSSSNTVTIAANGSETIDGSASITLIAEDEAVTLVSDGSNWHISSEFASPTGGNPFDQSLNTTDSPTFVNGDFTGTVTTNTVESDAAAGNMFIKSSSTSPIYIGHNGALTYSFYNTTFQPQADNAVQLGTVTKRWSQGHFANVNSVNGNFSGVVTTDAIQDSTGTGNIVLTNDGGALKRFSDNAIRWGFNSIELKGDVEQWNGGAGNFTIGTSGVPWNTGYFIDGSFSGNLNVESGGSQRVYGLGTEGDTDTEYLETSLVGGSFEIETKATGSGAVRTLNLRAGTFRFYAGGSLALASSVGYTLDSYYNIVPKNPTRYLGTTALRWANVASVDGDFSGTVTASNIQDSTGTGNIVLTNDGGSLRRFSDNAIRWGFNSIELKGNVEQWNGGAGNFTLGTSSVP